MMDEDNRISRLDFLYHVLDVPEEKLRAQSVVAANEQLVKQHKDDEVVLRGECTRTRKSTVARVAGEK